MSVPNYGGCICLSKASIEIEIEISICLYLTQKRMYVSVQRQGSRDRVFVSVRRQDVCVCVLHAGIFLSVS